MMSHEVLKCVAQELDESLRGGFVNKIHQPLPREVVLRIRAKGTAERKVMVSADPKFGRIHLTQLNIPNPQNPPRFCAFLRAHLRGAQVHSVSVAEDDRIVTMKCYKRTAQAIVTRLFILELLGRDSNILLVDGDSNTIMDCLFPIPERETATRVVLPGREYSLPPKRRQERVLTTSLPGEPGLRPSIVRTVDGKRQLSVCPFSEEDEIFTTMNRAADAFYSPAISGMILESLRRAYMAPLKTRIASLARRMEKIAQNKHRLERLAAGLEIGELLKANLHSVRKGMDRIEVTDWAGQRRVYISLDPSLNAIANMQRIFAKASKGKRGQAIVEKRMVDTEVEKRALEDLLFLLKDAETLEEISAIVEGATIFQPRRSALVKKKQFIAIKRGNSASGYRQYNSDSGFTILVGKTGRDNDTILRKKGREGDLWFHAKDVPGAHVVMQVDTGRVATQQDIERAAALAGYFSELRSAGKGEIMVTHLGNVRPVRGSVPGKVTVTNYKTVFAKWEGSGF